MKIIRPEYNTLQEIKVNRDEEGILSAERRTIETIEDVMDSVIKEYTDTIEFKIALTKKQYELWNKKGGLKWLKKALVRKSKKRKL